jgi:hypothetical protein
VGTQPANKDPIAVSEGVENAEEAKACRGLDFPFYKHPNLFVTRPSLTGYLHQGRNVKWRYSQHVSI